MRCLPVLLIVFSAVALHVERAAGAAAAPPVELLGEGDVAVKATQGSGKATMAIRLFNAGESTATIAVMLDAQPTSLRVASFAPDRIPPGTTQRVSVSFIGLETLRTEAGGDVIVTGGDKPVARAVAFVPAPQPAADWATIIVIGALVSIVVLVVAIVVVASLKKKLSKLGNAAPGPKWSFESWATTLTALGAVLGTVLGGASLPAVPREISKDTLIALNLLFGALVIVAPFVFQVIRKPSASSQDQEAGLWGYNWSLLLACAIACGAVLGELATLALISWELIGGGNWAWFAVGGLALLAVLGIYYFFITGWSLATADWADQADKQRVEAERKTRIVGTASGQRQGEAPEITIEAAARPRLTWSLP